MAHIWMWLKSRTNMKHHIEIYNLLITILLAQIEFEIRHFTRITIHKLSLIQGTSIKTKNKWASTQPTVAYKVSSYSVWNIGIDVCGLQWASMLNVRFLSA